MIVGWVLLACAKTGTTAPPPPAVKAGPRAILEGTGPTAVDDDGVSIGRNEVVAYTQKVRAEVMPRYRSCLADAGGVVAEDPLLVDVTILPDGKLRDVVMNRSSGNATVDDCGRKAFTAANLPEPPVRQIDDSGSFAMPTFAFPEG